MKILIPGRNQGREKHVAATGERKGDPKLVPVQSEFFLFRFFMSENRLLVTGIQHIDEIGSIHGMALGRCVDVQIGV